MMSSKLKQITTKAKVLYKSGKYKKWTDAIKAASKSIGSTKKTVGKVTLRKSNYHKNDERYIIVNDGKPHLEGKPFFKNEAKFIAEALRKVKKNRIKNKLGTVKKKTATKKKSVAKKSNIHKDTKSHNVNIKVVSGWRKGSTFMREKNEPKVEKYKNVRVSRNPKGGIFKPGTFANFSTLSGLFDTTVIKDIDSLKKEYFKLAKKYHPDAGGTTYQFQELGKEYEKLLKALLNGSTLNTEQKNNEIIIDKAIRDVIDAIITLEGINIELIGKWLWVGGNTYPVHKQLKSAGLVFIKKDKVPYWVYKGVESSSRGGTSMEEIKTKYGVHTFNPSTLKKISGFTKVNKPKLKRSLMKLVKALNKRPV